MKAGTTVLFGGTFDPPHIGHLLLAECARAELGARQVLFVPAGDPYRKTDAARAATEVRVVSAAVHREEMLRLAIRGSRGFVLDDRELRRPGPTYTVDTLRELHAEGHGELALVLGSDALADLLNWREPDAILALASVLGVRKPAVVSGIAAIDPAVAARVRWLETMPPVAVSSTLIRERVALGLPVRWLVPRGVEAYIRRERLYGAG